MKVKNQKCIRRLSKRSLWTSRKRNMIAIFAIVLTTLLFTSLFTIILSINASYETYNFRQMGGYSHGTFKEVTEEQAEQLSKHPGVKKSGKRIVCGIITDGVFGKKAAEVSFMDHNCSKWCYAQPTTGREPENADEIAMDTAALKLLGISTKLGAKVKLEYQLGDGSQTDQKQADTFTLVGYWEYDELMPVHYINVSEEYVKKAEEKWIVNGGDTFRIDLNVMLPSVINIEEQMQKIDSDLGYNWTTRGEENSVRIGVNWALTTSQMNSKMDPELLIAVVAFLILTILTGYLIINNIFQISVSGDIRFYGLLKTIGMTPRQLKRVIRQQALFLCMIGIPIGLLLGYTVGAVFTPIVLKSTSLVDSKVAISTSPWIFAGTAVLSLITIFLSCAKPGKMAAKVSPVEAVKYTDVTQIKKKRKNSHGAKVHQMALANLGRGKKKTALVITSLALSVTLFYILCSFVSGFDMEKYLASSTCADFIVSSTDYFRYNHADIYISEKLINEIQENTKSSRSGCGYTIADITPIEWIAEDVYKNKLSDFIGEEAADAEIALLDHRGDRVETDIYLEGLDPTLFEKLTVLDGSLEPMFEESTNEIAVCVDTDDYGNVTDLSIYPKVGETLTVTYIEEAYLVDTRTDEKADADTPEEYLEYKTIRSKDVDYTVCALVTIPYAMSFRYSGIGHNAVLPVEKLREDSEQNVIPLFYLFDTPEQTDEIAAEDYLAELTASDTSSIMYESKALKRAEFTQFQNMFLLLGGALCAVIGIIGILNFFNAIMTGILARKKEFAVLQSIGMTKQQLKKMIVYEGLFYTIYAATAAFVLSMFVGPLLGNLMEKMFWFFTYRFTIWPVVCAIPVFLFLGWLLPAVLYRQTEKVSIVDRLRE